MPGQKSLISPSQELCGRRGHLYRENVAETMGDLKRFIAASLILALSVVIGLHLALFWSSDGRLVIGEPNEVLRVIEAVLAAGIFVFGIERLVEAIRTQLSGRKD